MYAVPVVFLVPRCAVVRWSRNVWRCAVASRKRKKGDRDKRAATLTSKECNNAVALVEEMRQVGAMPNRLTYNVLISALAKAG